MARRLSESFINRMAEAAFWESYVATCLSRLGFHVLHFPTDIREDGMQKAGMYDAADLALMDDQPGDGWFIDRMIEVKAWAGVPPKVGHPGTDRHILCSQSSWVKKGYGHGLHPVFILVNKATGDMMWLPAHAQVSTGVLWSDPGRDYEEKVVAFYMDDLRPIADMKEEFRGLIQKT
jgi:hypothetical protein